MTAFTADKQPAEHILAGVSRRAYAFRFCILPAFHLRLDHFEHFLFDDGWVRAFCIVHRRLTCILHAVFCQHIWLEGFAEYDIACIFLIAEYAEYYLVSPFRFTELCQYAVRFQLSAYPCYRGAREVFAVDATHDFRFRLIDFVHCPAFVGKVDLPVFLQQKLKAKTGNVHEIKADWPKYGQAVPLVGKTEDAGMGTAERTASDKSATLRGINPANTDSTECPNPATAPTATAAKRSSTPTDTELAALAAPYRYTVRDGKKIGQHNGAHFYTIGQRKGLGIGGRKESLFVLATDVEQNVIYVGEGDNHPGLYRRALRIAPGELHWIDPLRELKTGESRRFDVRIRYRQPLQGAELFIRPDAAYLLFDEPQRGITPGQFAAWYDGDELVGSGVIAE